MADAREFIKGPGFYMGEYFNHWEGEQIVVDARPQNMIISFVPGRIRETVGDVANFIVCVRDPIERFYSDWLRFHTMRSGREPFTFNQAVDHGINNCLLSCFDSEWAYQSQLDPMGGPYRRVYAEYGFYLTQMVKFRQEFPEADVTYMFLEQARRTPENYLDRICCALGVERSSHPYLHRKQGSMPAMGEVIKQNHPDAYNKLAEFYSHEIDLLSDHLGYNIKEVYGWLSLKD